MCKKVYLQKERKVMTPSGERTERLYFPELNAGFDTEFNLYEIATVDGQVYARRKSNGENRYAQLKRIKQDGHATVFIIRKAFEENGEVYSRALIYNGDGDSSKYGRLCGKFAVLLGRSGDSVSVRSIKVIPIEHPELEFDFSINSGNPWISCQKMDASGGVLSIHGLNFRFVFRNGKYVQEKISAQEAESLRRKAPADFDGAEWLPVEFCR